MTEFIYLTSPNDTTYVININHIVAYYQEKDNYLTTIETTSKYGDGRFLAKESVSKIFNTINLIRQGGMT